MKLLAALRWVLEPAVAAVFLALWVVAEAGRHNTALVVMVLLAAGIALARLSWIASLVTLTFALLASASGATHPLGATDWPAYQAIGISIGLVWASHAWRARFVSLGAGAILSAAAVLLMIADGWSSWTGRPSIVSVVPLVGLAIVWMAFCVGIGFTVSLAERAVRQDRAQLDDRLSRTQTELTISAERERVAQEVHDVVAHSLAVILAQAEGARALSTKRPAAMTDALDKIAAQSRSALLDVRGIVDGLTGGAEPPQPTIDDLPELLRGVEEAGVAVRSTSAGEPRDLGLAQQAAVYRIVQEGSTNAIRHRGRGSALDVVLDWRGPGLSIQLVSSGTGDAVPAPGAGRGIPGMTDRARVAGGWLAAGEDESGDHRITAFVPFRDAEARMTTEPVPA